MNKKKPQIVMTYNETKRSVDKFDQLCNNMPCNRKTRWWPCWPYFTIWSTWPTWIMITWYIYKIFTKNKNSKPLSRQNFLIKLSDQLAKQHLMRRLTISKLLKKKKKENSFSTFTNLKINRKYCSFCRKKKE